MEVQKRVILLLVVLLANLVLSGCGDDSGQRHRVTTTKVYLRQLHSTVTQFKMDTGRFPSEEEGLMALIEAPSNVENYQPGGYWYTTDVPKDAWGREFVYQLLDEGRQFVITSYGADGKEGGEGYDADISTAPTLPFERENNE